MITASNLSFVILPFRHFWQSGGHQRVEWCDGIIFRRKQSYREKLRSDVNDTAKVDRALPESSSSDSCLHRVAVGLLVIAADFSRKSWRMRSSDIGWSLLRRTNQENTSSKRP
jgi:hypothetical protein